MVVSRARVSRALALIAAVAGLAGCPGPRGFIWVRDVPKTMLAADATYVIRAGDVIGIRVLGSDGNSVERVRVRDDGKISVPFLNDFDVADNTPDELAKRLEAKLKTYIVAPVVTVVIHERRPLRVAVVGKVVRPGVYELDRGAGVLHAIAAAGGLTPFASESSVYVIRNGYWADDATPARIRFKYGELLAGQAPASLFRLSVSDVVVVE
jgi:polysaccharide export outer membrane protein